MVGLLRGGEECPSAKIRGLGYLTGIPKKYELGEMVYQ
jgi:hypothetical protein